MQERFNLNIPEDVYRKSIEWALNCPLRRYSAFERDRIINNEVEPEFSDFVNFHIKNNSVDYMYRTLKYFGYE